MIILQRLKHITIFHGLCSKSMTRFVSLLLICDQSEIHGAFDIGSSHSSVWYEPKRPEEGCRHEIKQGTSPGLFSGGSSGKLGLSGDLPRDSELTPEHLVLISELRRWSENQGRVSLHDNTVQGWMLA